MADDVADDQHQPAVCERERIVEVTTGHGAGRDRLVATGQGEGPRLRERLGQQRPLQQLGGGAFAVEELCPRDGLPDQRGS